MSRWILGVSLLLGMATAQAAVLNFKWQWAGDDRADHFVLAWGYNSAVTGGGNYAFGRVNVPITELTATTPDIQLPPPDKVQKQPGYMFFAVKACNADETLCSRWSNEVSQDISEIPIPYSFQIVSITFEATP